MKSCMVEGCSLPVHAKGMCNIHYQRTKRNGDPAKTLKTPNGEVVRFFEDVVLAYEGAECLLWPYSTASNGYAQIWHDGKLRPVSRLVCEAKHGPAPTPEHEAAHSCGKGNLGCVTKGHLSWKTHIENEADKIEHGTAPRGTRNGQAKVTEADVLAIRSAAKRGVRQSSLVDQYGLSPASISFIVNRKNWAWLD